jgi:hypothetical protein
MSLDGVSYVSVQRRAKTVVVRRAKAESPATSCGTDKDKMIRSDNLPARPTLTLDQSDELLHLVLVEVGDGAERHP